MNIELCGLTPRQRQILDLVAQGLTNRQIARELHISEGTVKDHLSAVLDTLGVVNRTQAAVVTVHSRYGGTVIPQPTP